MSSRTSITVAGNSGHKSLSTHPATWNIVRFASPPGWKES
jgi:hypothetical protein